MSEIVDWNNLKSETLWMQRPKTPPFFRMSPCPWLPRWQRPPTPRLQKPPLLTSYYTIRQGDTLYKISQKYGVTITQNHAVEQHEIQNADCGQKIEDQGGITTYRIRPLRTKCRRRLLLQLRIGSRNALT